MSCTACNGVHKMRETNFCVVNRFLQAFPGHEDTSADWVLSVTALSGALNGTTRVYYDGIRYVSPTA
jgi:hypothetical protein